VNDILDVDVLVVGAGSAGAATALALAQGGRRVMLVDKRERGTTGARWVNAVPRWCFERSGFGVPGSGALFKAHAPASGGAMHLVAPSGRARVVMRGVDNLHVDMRGLVADLLARAEAAGALLRRGHVTDVVIEGDRARAVSFEDGSTRFTVRARLIVDASGIGGAVRRRVDVLARACPDAEPRDRCVAAQAQYEVRDRDALAGFLARHGLQPGDDVAFPGVAGGYSTLTLFTRPDLSEVGVLTGSIPALGVVDGGALLDRFVAGAPFLGAQLYGGRGAIPLRRPYTTLGAGGVALVGDAACQVYSSHGSGVGVGLLAARALAESVGSEDDPGGSAALDAYGRRFRGAHGGLLAASDAFRRHVQGLGPDDLDRMIGTGLLDESLASAALEQRSARPDLAFLLAAPGRAARSPGAAARFLPVAARSVLLDRLGPLTALPAIGAAIDRALETLVGRGAELAPAATWSMPSAT
jgi:flavin-dependent dehydrogenase